MSIPPTVLLKDTDRLWKKQVNTRKIHTRYQIRYAIEYLNPATAGNPEAMHCCMRNSTTRVVKRAKKKVFITWLLFSCGFC